MTAPVDVRNPGAAAEGGTVGGRGGAAAGGRGTAPEAGRGAAKARERDTAPTRGRAPAVATADLPRRALEIDIFPGRLEIVERYGDGDAARLAEALARLGLSAHLAFRAPCG